MDSVLFVDDEKLITNSLKRGLINEKYKQFFVNSGEAALEILEKETISVVVTDMKMPGMTGLALLNIVKEKYPNTIRVVLSGYTQLPQVLVTINQAEIFKFITKPWNLESEFKFVIREAVDYYNFKEGQQKTKETLEKKNVIYQNMLKKYDDIVNDLKQEIKGVIKINSCIFDEINQIILTEGKLKQNSEIIVEKIQLFENLLADMLSVIPRTTKKSSINKLIEELETNLGDMDFITKLEVGIDKSVESSYRGQYDFLLHLLKNMITLIFNNSSDYKISMIVVAERSTEDNSTVTFILKANSEFLKQIEDVKKILNVMQTFIEGTNSELLVRNVNENVVVTLKAKFCV